MNATLPRAEWSRARWVGTICVLFLIQLGVLHRWAVVPSLRSAADGRRTAVAWMTDPAGLDWIAGAGWISSPRKVIALEDGAFSRAAERSLPRTSYQLFEWNLTPRWLDNGSGRWLPAAAPGPGVPEGRPDAPGRITAGAAPLPLRTASRLEVDPAGSARLESPADGLPEWRVAEIIGPSRVEALVGPGGQVLSARLRESCGHRPADESALDRARALQFRPLPPIDGASPWDADRLQWVDLRFRWRLVPAGTGSNAVPGAVR